MKEIIKVSFSDSFLFCVLSFLYFIPSVFAQLSEGGKPYSYTHFAPAQIQTVIMPPVNVPKLLAEDESEQSKGLPFRFGVSIDVDYNMNNSGTWISLPNGAKLWRLNIKSVNASTINFIFKDFWLPPGSEFFIYNEQKSECIGAFTYRNNKEDGTFATGILRGESMILEYYEPAGVSSPGTINLANVIHGYKNIFNIINEINDFGSSGACEINVNCPAGAPWAYEKRSVALVITSNGTRLCSGSLMNNVRKDLSPYLLTAEHCNDGATAVWVIMFNYESPSCVNADGPLNYTISGATLKASNAATDFCLVKLNEAVPDSYVVHYNGWNALDFPAENAVCIHHPKSDVKKISFSFNALVSDTFPFSPSPSNSHWKVFWPADGSGGVTEPGSSGAPIYDQNHSVVGQLHGGLSSCTGSDKTDYLGKLSMSWTYGGTPATRLKDWLDPDNTGALVLDGFHLNIGPRDSVPPTRITDLSVTAPTSNSLTLKWSAPLDTTYGGVREYDIRISNSAINNIASFYDANRIPFNGIIETPGTIQSQVVSSLNFSGTYYFAIRSKDMWNNWSQVSNSPGGTSLAAPVLLVTPDSIHHVLPDNISLTDSIDLKNNSPYPSTLNYSIKLENNTFPPGKVNIKLVPVVNKMFQALNKNIKGVPQNVNAGQSIGGFGGPDSFGYKWIDSDAPKGPGFIWNDISASGTEVTNWAVTGSSFDCKDEGIAGPLHLGFNFKFYGIVKNHIYISTNGILLFDTVSQNIFANSQIPDSSIPNNFIAPFWNDLDGISQGHVYYKQSGNMFIVQFTNWHKYIGGGSVTFQIVLSSGGKIIFYYKDMAATLNGATVGIENGDGSSGLQVVYNAPYIHDSLAVMFTAAPDWLSVDGLSGSLGQGNDVRLFVTWQSEDYPSGEYHMDIMISSNDPVTPLKRVPAAMTIEPVSVIRDNVEAPKQFLLLQNYPNPFNPDTRIMFSIPVKSFVKLIVFNELGEKMGELLNENMEPGYHEVLFNRKLSSGVYFYRIETENFTDTKKMIIIK